MNSNPKIQIPGILGTQAQQKFFTIIMNFKNLVKFFEFTNSELPPESRAQRILSESRAKAIANYIIENPKKYILPAITASISGDFDFIPSENNPLMGILEISLDCKFLINDGQHRAKGIQLAIEQDLELENESISVVLFIDHGLKRAQQIFSDINSNAKATSASLNILYNHRSKQAAITKSVVNKVEVFKRYTEMEKTTISGKSTKLFVLKHLHNAINASMPQTNNYTFDLSVCAKYWNLVAERIAEWQDVIEKRFYAEDVRRQFISCSAIVLNSLGKIGKQICEKHDNAEAIAQALEPLRTIDWDRNNQIWFDICIFEGKVVNNSKTRNKMVEYLEKVILNPIQTELIVEQNVAQYIEPISEEIPEEIPEEQLAS